MKYLCKKYPILMIPILFVFLFTGVWSLIVIVALVIRNNEDFFYAHKECVDYIFRRGKNKQ